MIVGIGALGRATATDLAWRGGRRNVVGFLAWPGESTARELCAPLLGSTEQLAACIAKHGVSEVYIAASAKHHGDALDALVQTCERSAVKFAVPAVPFRLTRGRARSGSFPDGYIHFAVAPPDLFATTLHGLRDVAAGAWVRWMMAPLVMLVRMVTLLVGASTEAYIPRG